MKLICLIPTLKINSRWIKDLNIRPETNTLPEENIGKEFLDISLDIDLLGMTAKTKATKAKISKWEYMKLKIFCTAKK